ncbi:cell division protein FtsK [Microbacterium esteraromaticum]|uniref:Cell division protein FtsK n=1 Tax=Microbacterium esteraromaticum TaxID=57043 RepID=A0A7D7WJD8_9MICO|nr:FtsK/SpoIIIE domain-containing protein [Microbacterium esteraromaticum]QMU97890.1 cell division protein FtsK [Microbacterium esteraromaticum]
MDATTIVLPAAAAEPARPPLPLLAAIVPVIAGVVLWLITGSLFALCFAALGPLMLLASFLDGLRARRRARRSSEHDSDAAWQHAEDELVRLHDREQRDLRHRSPDAAGCLLDPPLRGRTPLSASTELVIGRGDRRSRIRASGGDDARSRAFRERAERLTDAPIVVELGGGVCVRTAQPVAAAVIRALVTQLCLRFGPTELSLHGSGVQAWGLSGFPHASRRRARFRLRLGDGSEPADAVFCIRMPGDEPPEGVTTVLDCIEPRQATARTPEGMSVLSLEGLSARQTAVIAADAAARAEDADEVPDAVALADLEQVQGGDGRLAACLGRREHGEVLVDLVDDGPHAIVTGMTGTGKSELLISWVAGIAAAHSPEEVAFVLIDFKGGTAFDPLRVLPHVVAVVTDLDALGARRGVGSLTAELRRREALLAAAGARDVAECPSLVRLVIVVDEFAALVREHPDLAQIFTDVAARGRALGMHLVLGTQRAGGVIREALAANCPLRLSLRVAESADSRLVIGTDAAAALPGGAESRGLAYVRRPEDAEPQVMRVALTSPSDLAATARRWAGSAGQDSPWLPPLPALIDLPAQADPSDGGVVLGRADEPQSQSQPWVRLAAGEGLAVIGGAGAGKSTLIGVLRSQVPDAVVIPSDAEEAWDAVAELVTGRHGMVLCDDLDLLLAQYPPEQAQLFLSRWETIIRAPEGAVITSSRASGPVGRLLDALPRRVLLRLSSRVEHIAAGGDSGTFDPHRLPGRGWFDGRDVQLCWTDALASTPVGPRAIDGWRPRRARSGVVTAASEATRRALSAALPDCRVIMLAELSGVTGPDIGGEPLVVVADPEEWRSHWAVLQSIRSSGELVVSAECQAELRQLAGVRETPPFARPHEDRAWAVEAGGRPRRVLLR